MKPILLINFKKKSGKEAKNIIDKLLVIKNKLGYDLDICLALQPKDAIKYSNEIDFKVYIQDTFSEEKITSLNNFNNKIEGIIINHPDKKDSYQSILEKTRLAEFHSLKSILCATNIEEAIELNNQFNPDFIGIEYAIGDNDIDFITKHKNILDIACQNFKGKFLLGGGIKNSDDVFFAINSGASGVLVSGLIINSVNPDDLLRDLIEGILKIENDSLVKG